MPKTNAEKARELAKNSSDCSFLLSHLIRQNNGKTDSDACNVLLSILGIIASIIPLLKSANTGWYGHSTEPAKIYNPVTSKFDAEARSKAVCFTESTLAGLRAHRDLFNVKYGLTFDRDWLFQQGANPCLNISESIFKSNILRNGETYPRHVYNFIPPELHPYINIVHDSFDATHEREWRYAGDLNFDIENVRFIFCPESEFHLFSSVQKCGLPCFFDLLWLDRI